MLTSFNFLQLYTKAAKVLVVSEKCDFNSRLSTDATFILKPPMKEEHGIVQNSKICYWIYWKICNWLLPSDSHYIRNSWIFTLKLSLNSIAYFPKRLIVVPIVRWRHLMAQSVIIFGQEFVGIVSYIVQSYNLKSRGGNSTHIRHPSKSIDTCVKKDTGKS